MIFAISKANGRKRHAILWGKRFENMQGGEDLKFGQ